MGVASLLIAGECGVLMFTGADPVDDGLGEECCMDARHVDAEPAPWDPGCRPESRDQIALSVVVVRALGQKDAQPVPGS